MAGSPDSLADFVDREVRDLSLAVVNRTRPKPIHDMLADLFAEQSVRVEERQMPDAEEDVVLLLEDGDVVATSPLQTLEEELLTVNSDLYITGAKSLEDVSLPAVIEHLAETPFRLRGYPLSHSEKLPLIVLSRYIERLAWNADSGRLRSSFQHLSRLDDERGTREVYRRLGDADVDVHVYGVPDWLPPESFPGVVHAGYHGEFRSAWFVVFHTEGDARTGALVAEEVGENEWEGLWTFQPDRVREINRYVERTL